ncbi:MAG: hypothetical protein ABFD08_18685 [Syntrophomonas sp.]
MTKLEQETIILFNEEEEIAVIETPVKAFQKQLEKLGANEIKGRKHVFEGILYKTYELPKDWIKIHRAE